MSRLAILLAALAAAAGCGARAGTLEVSVLDPAGKPVADAAVYAVPSNPVQEPRGRTAQVQQIDREFVPFVSVVQVGTAVSFPNRDPILHHVYSFSPAKPFEIKLYSGKSPLEVTFDKPGVVVLGCNIHDWMLAYVVAVPTPYFARTEGQGTVRLRDLPAGTYELHAWHPMQRASLPAQSVAVSAAGTLEASFELDLQPRKAKFKPPLDRLKY
jgi:plastocyanin